MSAQLATLLLLAADDGWKQSLQSALELHQSGDLRAACPRYNDAIQGNPDLKRHPGVLTNWGLALQAEERPEEAVGAFERVIELQPADANSYFNLGNAHLDASQHDGAIDAFRNCLQLSPTDAEAYYELGLALLQKKEEARNEDAVASLKHSLELAPSDPKAWVALGDGRATQQRWEESEASYRKACAIRPSHGPSWSNLGNALEELGRLGEAESSWRAATSLEPFDGLSGCYQNLGAMLRRADRMPESRSAYSAALKVEPRSAEAYMGLGRCGIPASGGSTADASFGREYIKFLAQTYGNAIKLEPANAGAYVAVGEGMRMFGLQGGADEFGGDGALEMYAHALELMPGNTCAKTHVAYGDRAPCSEEANARLMTGGGNEPGLDGDTSSTDGGRGADLLTADAKPTVESLSAPTPPRSAEDIEAALALWRKNGVAIFPSLLSKRATEKLLERVRKAQKGDHTRDYTIVTRDKSHRCHKALPVSEAEPAIKEIAQALAPFFEAALGSKELALLESGFMVTGPGASAQNFHRDVAPAVVSRSSVTVSVQISLVDTAANQGCFEVVPGSQAYDAKVSDRTRLETMPKVKVGAPQGTVTVYALHTMHRGSANTHDKDRPFFFFTLMGEGLPPPGLAYTMQPEDIGKWRMAGGKVRK